ncbi:hypothetical protein DACRYDRAFT_48367, partial [Dacryopinax primogenitus]
EVVISVSVYTAHSVWPHGLRLSSSHELLASNTLADLLKIIPCQSTSIPHAADRMFPEIDLLDRACIGIEDVMYGQHPEDAHSVTMLLQKLNSQTPSPSEIGHSSLELKDVRIGSLSLRMNYPYWIFHAGMCEHVWTVDDIHLHHPSEPQRIDYPITTFLPASITPNCGVCKVLPAILAVSGDLRLDNSPCFVCKVCWDLLGWPQGDIYIKVVRLIGRRTGT